MTIAELTERVEALEQKLGAIHPGSAQPGPRQPRWRTTAGRFADDPDFDDIVRLGREYRESLRERDETKGGAT